MVSSGLGKGGEIAVRVIYGTMFAAITGIFFALCEERAVLARTGLKIRTATKANVGVFPETGTLL